MKWKILSYLKKRLACYYPTHHSLPEGNDALLWEASCTCMRIQMGPFLSMAWLCLPLGSGAAGGEPGWTPAPLLGGVWPWTLSVGLGRGRCRGLSPELWQRGQMKGSLKLEDIRCPSLALY